MMRFIAFILCRIFFKKISLSGTPYIGKSTIWAANHSSAIVDPTVMLGLAPVRIRPLAKQTLWEMPVMRSLLRFTRAIPVNRLQDMKIDIQAQKDMLDQGNSEVDWRIKANSEAFQMVSEALLDGDSILIFPEGVSHDDPYIYQFKSGLARMALQAISKSTDPNFFVIIQPVVIDYSEKDEFRSELYVHYCEPVAISSKEMSVKEIMYNVRESMENGFASFFNWDEKRNWRFLFELSYGRIPYSSREFRVFVEKYRPEFDKDLILQARIQTIRRLLQAILISPIQLVWGDLNYKKRSFFWVLFRHGWFFMCITLPIQILGAIVWLIPAKFCEKLAKKSTSDRDVRATMKIAHGIWFFPFWAFLMSSLFTFLLTGYLPHTHKIIIWCGFLVLTPTFLVLSLILAESINFFPGFLRLAFLRLFFPRSWYELMQEWRDMTDEVLAKIKRVDEPENI